MARNLPLYQAIATALDAYVRCAGDNANESQASWESTWRDVLARYARNNLPNGSGFDCTPEIDSTFYRNRIVVTGSYHAMGEHGGYDGWRDFRVTIRPDLMHGFTVTVSGARGEMAKYIGDTYAEALRAVVDIDSAISRVRA